MGHPPKVATANAIYNGATNPPRPGSALATIDPKLASTDQFKVNLNIARDVFVSRQTGGIDPVDGRKYFGNTYGPNSVAPRYDKNKYGSWVYPVHQSFGPFQKGANGIVTERDIYVVIYDDPVKEKK